MEIFIFWSGAARHGRPLIGSYIRALSLSHRKVFYYFTLFILNNVDTLDLCGIILAEMAANPDNHLFIQDGIRLGNAYLEDSALR